MSSQKRARSGSPQPSNGPSVYKSEEIHDRQSIFIGHFSAELSPRALQSQDEIASSMHKMLAWRKPSAQKSIRPGAVHHETGTDEDGEKHAGKTLERVLREENVAGAVVVARWYGGIMLGPVRFTHIEQCARGAINAWRQACEAEASEAKRRKVDESDRQTLLEELPERDENILALRQLLTEKKAAQEGADTQSQPPPVSPSKPIEYGKMSVEVLRRLDKARDSTVAVLLKKIDEAEKQHKPP